MIQSVFAQANVARLAVVLLIFAAYVFFFALVIICLIRVSRYFLTAGKEQKLIRMEIGKLAEEVHQLRHDLKGSEKGNSLDKSD